MVSRMACYRTIQLLKNWASYKISRIDSFESVLFYFKNITNINTKSSQIGLVQETMDVIAVFTRALKPDDDGKVRID